MGPNIPKAVDKRRNRTQESQNRAITQHIAVPQGWGAMTEAEKNKFVNDARVKIAAAGVDVVGHVPSDLFEAAEG